MATCGSLRHIFESTIPENKSSSSLIDSLSPWKQIRPLKPPADHSFTEIFGELHFKEVSNTIYSPRASQSNTDSQGYNVAHQDDDKWGHVASDSTKSYPGSSYQKRSESLPSLNSESLQLCTEGLGSESLGDVEDLTNKFSGTWQSHSNTENTNNSHNYFLKNNNCFNMEDKVHVRGYSGDPYRKNKTNGRSFPPPISCIGRTGKPCVCFQSYRQDGRFVLKEIRIPTHERLQASREDGRLRLCFIQPSNQDEDDDNGGDNEIEEAATDGEDEGRDKEELRIINEEDGEGREHDEREEKEQEKKEAEARMEEKGHS